MFVYILSVRLIFIYSWKIDAKVSTTTAKFSDAQIVAVVSLYQSVPFPELKQEQTDTEIFVEVSENYFFLIHF